MSKKDEELYRIIEDYIRKNGSIKYSSVLKEFHIGYDKAKKTLDYLVDIGKLECIPTGEGAKEYYLANGKTNNLKVKSVFDVWVYEHLMNYGKTVCEKKILKKYSTEEILKDLRLHHLDCKIEQGTTDTDGWYITNLDFNKGKLNL